MQYYKQVIVGALIWLSYPAYNAEAGWASFLQQGHPEYHQLESALDTYNAMAKEGKWITIPRGPSIKPGTDDPRIALLRKRLAQQKIIPDTGSSTLYDADLQKAVQKFQAMHGLTQDGVIGNKVINALNVPLAKRIKQITLNMERWDDLPDDLGERHINVNIPGFELQAIDHGKLVLDMRIIIGKIDRKTPVFSSIITDVIFHPYWHVPNSIARDKLSIIQHDPHYLVNHDIEVLDSAGNSVDPYGVDWKAVPKGSFPYTLRQDPGEANALGKVRFSIQGDQSIYMHGTPEQKLFESATRAQSSGCIRVERPLDLIYFVLQDAPKWPRSRIDDLYNNKDDTVKALLPIPLQVHILYLTSWVDKYGQIQFRDDIYGLDK